MLGTKTWRLFSLLVIVAMLLVACGGAATTEAPAAEEPAEEPAAEEPAAEEPASEMPTELRIAVLFASGVEAAAWDGTFFESYQRVQANTPHDLVLHDMVYTEGQWGDEAEATMREFAESGEYDIIWPHGTYNDNINNLRDEYPDILWMEVGSGVIDHGGNNYHFWHRCHEGTYLMGLLAGHMAQNGVVGSVGGFPAADVNDNINGFFAGAKSVNADIQQKIAFINTWYDPALSAEAANAQIAAGADQLLMMAESFDICQDGVICYGPYLDYTQFYPDGVLASFVATWDPAIEWAVDEWYQAQVSGEPFDAPDSLTFSMVNGGCDVVINENLMDQIPAEALEAFEQAKQEILDGTLVVDLNIETPESD